MIFLKSKREIAIMREAGRLVAQAHLIVQEHLKPGVTTQHIDQAVDKFIEAQHCIPSFKGYRGFPAATCISVNEEMVHGIPGSRVIHDGDLVKVDIGVIYQGYHGDSVWTYGVGHLTDIKRKLMETTEQALMAGVAQATVGHRMGDISAAMQQVVETVGFSVNREYGGHGVGKKLHEDPSVPNYGEVGKGLLLRTGMVLAIEPIVCVGDWHSRVLADHWTVITQDGSLSAQYEHTVAITDHGPEIMTIL